MASTDEQSVPEKQKTLKELLQKKNITFSVEEDLIGEIWDDRPALSCEQVMELDMKVDRRIQGIQDCRRSAQQMKEKEGRYFCADFSG